MHRSYLWSLVIAVAQAVSQKLFSPGTRSKFCDKIKNIDWEAFPYDFHSQNLCEDLNVMLLSHDPEDHSAALDSLSNEFIENQPVILVLIPGRRDDVSLPIKRCYILNSGHALLPPFQETVDDDLD
jgi:hypothetical protein